MTTVICTLKEMAADKRVSWGENPSFDTLKIFKINNSIYGYAGDVSASLRFIKWVEQDFKEAPIFDKDDDKDDFNILELTSTGIYLWDKQLSRMPIKNKHYAIGTGSLLAIYLLDQGLSPREIIKIISKYDGFTSSEADVITLRKNGKR